MPFLAFAGGSLRVKHAVPREQLAVFSYIQLVAMIVRFKQ
jgi:hypothetical protein